MNARYGIVAAVLMALLAGAALGATKEELKKRTDARRPKIDALKRQGVIGETWQGYVEVVKTADKDAQKLVTEENGDRAEVYRLISEGTAQGNEKLTPDQVAQRAAAKFFEHAAKGEWLKYKDGWKQKA